MNRWVLFWLLCAALALNSFWLNIAFLDRRGWAIYQLLSTYANCGFAVFFWEKQR